jgi:hypothetical protein
LSAPLAGLMSGSRTEADVVSISAGKIGGLYLR